MLFGKSTKQFEETVPEYTTMSGLMTHNEELLTVSRAKFVCHARVIDPALRQRNALGLDNPKMVAWELIPGSFIYDWFHPIANYLQNVQALNGYTFVDGCEIKSTHAMAKHTVTGTWNSMGYNYYYTNQEILEPAIGRHFYKRYDRNVIGDFPQLPYPEFSLEKVFSISHALTSLSLLKIFKG
jgi:hypothetical protein